MSNPFRPVSPASSSFLPEDYIARKTETRVNVLILGLFAMVLGGVVAAFVVTNRHWHEIHTRQENVNEQWALEGAKMDQLRALEKQRAQMMEKAEITAALVERVPRWAVLGEVALRMPPDMRLDSMAIKCTRTDPVTAPPAKGPAAAPLVKSLTDKVMGNAPVAEKPRVTAPKFSYALTIVGSTAKNTDVADFLASLKNSPALKGVELTYIREAKEKERELRKFEILAQLRPDTDTGKLAASLQSLIADRTATVDGGKDAAATAPEAPAGVVEKGGN
jgi:Tfp pilus assembly protein PilN